MGEDLSQRIGDDRVIGGPRRHGALDPAHGVVGDTWSDRGTRPTLGTAVVSVSEAPHTGCVKFSRRFGRDPLRLVNTPDGRAGRFRGLNARTVEAGADEVRAFPTTCSGGCAPAWEQQLGGKAGASRFRCVTDRAPVQGPVRLTRGTSSRRS